jgi:hypothetical protein
MESQHGSPRAARRPGCSRGRDPTRRSRGHESVALPGPAGESSSNLDSEFPAPRRRPDGEKSSNLESGAGATPAGPGGSVTVIARLHPWHCVLSDLAAANSESPADPRATRDRDPGTELEKSVTAAAIPAPRRCSESGGLLAFLSRSPSGVPS